VCWVRGGRECLFWEQGVSFVAPRWWCSPSAEAARLLLVGGGGALSVVALARLIVGLKVVLSFGVICLFVSYHEQLCFLPNIKMLECSIG